MSDESENKPEIIQIHSIRRGETLYVSIDDIANYLKELAMTEEIDVKNRIEEAVFNLMQLKKQ